MYSFKNFKKGYKNIYVFFTENIYISLNSNERLEHFLRKAHYSSRIDFIFARAKDL